MFPCRAHAPWRFEHIVAFSFCRFATDLQTDSCVIGALSIFNATTGKNIIRVSLCFFSVFVSPTDRFFW
jgi:hypothetical protein